MKHNVALNIKEKQKQNKKADKMHKKKGGGRMCTWGVKSRWRGGVAHHGFCQKVVIRVSVVGSKERVS